MRKLPPTPLLCLLISATPLLADPPQPPPGFKWVRNESFSDEFNGKELDSSKWYDHHPSWRGRPPAKFVPDTVSLRDGSLQIKNRVLDPPEGPFSIAGGAVVSRTKEAFYGYYEVRMKASRISMSSTFWFSNRPSRSDPKRTAQELDVQEAVGEGKRQPDRKHYMKSNTHYWHRKDRKYDSIAVPGEARISPPAGEAYHVYGAWWVDANTIKFYHNDKYVFTLRPDTSIDETPFDRPMQMNLVTETYDWETPPTPEELADDTINTTYYDWVRSYKLVPDRQEAAEPPGSDAEKYLTAVRAFADTVLQHGRDTFGSQETPLLVDGLHATSLEPVRWIKDDETWVLSNFASQQPLMRLLDGLSAVTGEPKYRDAAEAAARYTMQHVQAPNGLLYWGGHLAWDLASEKPVGQYADVHELKGHQPYYQLMWRVEPDATRRLMEAVWAGHILDWSRLDYNRHASVRKQVTPHWEHDFDDSIEVPFPAQGSNLSFANVTPPLVHTGCRLNLLGDDPQALEWTHRLLTRWQEGKDPKTGLCGGQLSYRKDDRAHTALGHVHPSINEAKIVASYHQTSRYHQIPLIQMQAAEALIKAGGARADLGRRWIRWASADLITYANSSFEPKSNTFRALMTDGTPIRWRESKTGYYVPSSFAPVKPNSLIFWNYAMAYRLTRDNRHWEMAATLFRELGLGDIGKPTGHRNLALDTSSADWRVIYGLLELYRATGDDNILRLGRRVADNLMRTQVSSGLFPRRGREYARTGDEAPLALLHLAAALCDKSELMPEPVYDSRFFHCEYHGPLEESQIKRADKRTYDHLVFYGGS